MNNRKQHGQVKGNREQTIVHKLLAVGQTKKKDFESRISYRKQRNIFRQRGSIMMQVLVSLFILSLGLTGSLSVIIAAMESNATSESRMIAANLAQESVEAFRSIRDTNWMVYESNLRECWHFWDDTDEDGDVDGDDNTCTPDGFGQNEHPWTIAESTDSPFFIVDFDSSNFRWKIIPEPRFDNISTIDNGDDGYRLYTSIINDSKFYTHDNTSGNLLSIFSRKMEMYFIDAPGFDDTTDPITPGAYPDNTTDPSPNTQTRQDNRILLISTVSWTQKGRSHEIVLSTVMTDFLDRHEWDT